MKKAAVISLAVLIASLNFKDLFTYLEFYLNRDYIACNLCINLNDPAAMCYGSCFLKKSLKANQEQEQKYPFAKKEERSNTVYLPIARSALCSFSSAQNHTQITGHPGSLYSFTYLTDIFHPPSLG